MADNGSGKKRVVKVPKKKSAEEMAQVDVIDDPNELAEKAVKAKQGQAGEKSKETSPESPPKTSQAAPQQAQEEAQEAQSGKEAQGEQAQDDKPVVKFVDIFGTPEYNQTLYKTLVQNNKQESLKDALKYVIAMKLSTGEDTKEHIHGKCTISLVGDDLIVHREDGKSVKIKYTSTGLPSDKMKASDPFKADIMKELHGAWDRILRPAKSYIYTDDDGNERTVPYDGDEGRQIRERYKNGEITIVSGSGDAIGRKRSKSSSDASSSSNGEGGKSASEAKPKQSKKSGMIRNEIPAVMSPEDVLKALEYARSVTKQPYARQPFDESTVVYDFMKFMTEHPEATSMTGTQIQEAMRQAAIAAHEKEQDEAEKAWNAEQDARVQGSADDINRLTEERSTRIGGAYDQIMDAMDLIRRFKATDEELKGIGMNDAIIKLILASGS